MPNNAYKVLMEESFRTHEHLHKLFYGYFSKSGGRELEPAEITEARENFIKASEKLWSKLLYPLQSKFNTNAGSAVEEVLDFLEIDIPAFRCGYLKEHFLERLKGISLTDTQKLRLRGIALELCKNDTVRREFRRWVNLMRQIADKDFVNQLQDLLTTNSKTRAAKLMLEGVLTQKELTN